MSDENPPDGAAGDGAADPGDETRRLLDAVQEWARRTLPAPPSGHPGPECQWCPLCQLASVLRGEHPELLERVAEAGAAITDAVRALADPAAARRPGSEPGRTPGEGRPHPRPRPDTRVQRIRLTDPTEPPTGPASENEEPQ